MSNVGKTYWSKKLESVGFERFGCDDMIEERLEKELRNQGFNGIHDVAKWLGQPFEPQYERNSKKYLEIEKNVMGKVIDKLCYHDTYHGNIVVDTTGSVIYTGGDTLKSLANLSTVVLLDVSNEALDALYESYIREPKPVVWGESFKKQNGESDMQALRLCYPKLLQYRTVHYKRLAHKVVEAETLRAAHFDAYQFLQLLNLSS